MPSSRWVEGTRLADEGVMQRSRKARGGSEARHTALLLIDFMNPLDFDGASSLAPRALKAASCAAALKKRLIARRVPVIYANDNFGRWESDFHAIIADCEQRGGASAAMARLLAPGPQDRSVLKPRHSAFFGTPLDFLLDELGTSRLVLTGLAADSCIMFTAHDAYLRQYGLWIPEDCVASEKDAWRRDALAYMSRVLKARTEPALA
jgi:nicotinamidase-related amidase